MDEIILWRMNIASSGPNKVSFARPPMARFGGVTTPFRGLRVPVSGDLYKSWDDRFAVSRAPTGARLVLGFKIVSFFSHTISLRLHFSSGEVASISWTMPGQLSTINNLMNRKNLTSVPLRPYQASQGCRRPRSDWVLAPIHGDEERGPAKAVRAKFSFVEHVIQFGSSYPISFQGMTPRSLSGSWTPRPMPTRRVSW